MTCIPGVDRTQAVLLPEVLDDFVGSANPVRFPTACSRAWCKTA